MNEHVATDQGALQGDLPDEHGLFFTYHFDAAGFATRDEAGAAWVWRSYHLGDMRARHELATEPALPTAVREAFLSSATDCHIDLEERWLYGD